LLVNLHGQHESQALLHPDAQLSILDAFAGATELAQGVRERHAALVRVRAEIASLTARRLDAERRADYLRHVVREIEGTAPQTGEESKLDEEIRRLAHVEELRGQIEQMREALDGEESAALSLLATIRRHLAAAERIDPSLGRLDELIEGATYQLDELSRALQEYDSALDADPARLSELERRRDTLFRLTSKYGPTFDDVLDTLDRSRAELELVDTAELDLRSLGARETAAQKALAAESSKLSEQRSAASARLAGAVEHLFPDLGMSEGKFEAALVPLAETGPAGAESVEFRVSLNAGHEPRALARVASGGELSRVMLAMKSILARLDETPTLVFDEVDAGIGGRVALKVGDAMRRLAAHHQVVAITHIAQIAARAHHHIVVSKGARDGVTTADIEVVAGEGRVTELARMLGGDPHSDVSRAHARELQAAAEEQPTGGGTTAEARRPARRRAR
jgi:DNA repair protein RecN (Recombination protein N)